MLYVTSMHYRQSGKGISVTIPFVCSLDRPSHTVPLRPSKRTLRALAQCYTVTRFKRTS